MPASGYRGTPEERFVTKFQVTSSCWLWTGATTYNGYGRFYTGQKVTGAHQFSYELYNGDIPSGLCVLHICDIRLCVNPNHLRLGTYQDNNQDTANKRHNHNQLKDTCPSGHIYNQENTRIYENRRYCRACDRARRK